MLLLKGMFFNLFPSPLLTSFNGEVEFAQQRNLAGMTLMACTGACLFCELSRGK